MSQIATLCCLLVLLHAPAVSLQGDDDRQRALEGIMRAQDLRRGGDIVLRNALVDRDSALRDRAALACASLQDTTLLPLLLDLLHDKHRSIQEGAAFAIGQTASRLSDAGRRSFERELLTEPFARTQAKNRVLEELGKFATNEGLEMILRQASPDSPLSLTAALSMSLARFAIRGITSDAAIGYLVSSCQPMETTLWQTVYALQRSGETADLRAHLGALVPLREHADPLVRMHLALLLGRLIGVPPVIDALQALAFDDPDWRVRVNAARVLAGCDTGRSDRTLRTYARLLAGEHEQVRLAALGGIASARWDLRNAPGSTGELRKHIERLPLDPDLPVQVRAEATVVLPAVLGPSAMEAVMRIPQDEPMVEAARMRAFGITGSCEALPFLFAGAESREPAIVCAAIEGVLSLLKANPGDTALASACRRLALTGVAGPDVAVTTTAAAALGALPLRDSSVVEPLVRRLSELRPPVEIEAIQEIARTLGLLGNRGAVPALESLLRSTDPAARVAGRDALQSILGTPVRIEEEADGTPTYTDFDFGYLRALPGRPRVTLETSKGTMVLELNPGAAPFTVLSFLKLALGKGFYDGTTFHRVVPNFVVQGGDPRGDGWGGPGYAIRSEFSPLRFETATLGIASAGKDTEGCQFFITHSPQPHLDGRYTIFGRVIEGEDAVEKLLAGDRIVGVSLSAPGEGHGR
jgi:peptidylprolyl isomerase